MASRLWWPGFGSPGYRSMVVSRLKCPSYCCTSRMLTPRMRRWVAKLCLKVCTLAGLDMPDNMFLSPPTFDLSGNYLGIIWICNNPKLPSLTASVASHTCANSD